jgi:hypothetical protein
MHPLHDYVAGQIAEKLKDRRIVVWYDRKREYERFVAELRGGSSAGGLTKVSVAGVEAALVEFRDSFLELRSLVEPIVSGDSPDPLLIYLLGVEQDRRGSLLMELEKAGICYDRPLKVLARSVLKQRYTDGVIDERLKPEGVTYEDLAQFASDSESGEPPSLLKVVFGGASGKDAILTAWLASDTRDAEIEKKQATGELVKLVRSRLAIELYEGAALAKLRAVTLRYVLASEFRADLLCAPPAALDSVTTPKTKADEDAVRDVARHLRASHGDEYAALAERIETELGLRSAKIPPDALGSIDTFPFEERALLKYCGDLIAKQRFDEAAAIVDEREHSFWLDRDVNRKAQWEAYRRMAELGKTAVAIRSAVTKAGNDPAAWVDAYAEKDGWHRLDLAQRRLEAWITALDDDPEERPLGVARRAYDDASHAMAEGFGKALRGAGWSVKGKLHQTHVFSEVLSAQPKPAAYFLVDAMRYEMGVELAARLPKTGEVTIRPAIGSLPSITPIGMAALMPGASGSFAVVEEGGKLGGRIGDAFLPDLGARRKYAAAVVPKLTDIALDELLGLPPSKLKKRINGAQVVVVRSQEIDHAGEGNFPFQARQVMDTVIDNLVRAIRKLAAAGVARSVVTADHGHLFSVERDESMRTETPGGDKVELHRRCWIGRGGSTPPGCVRVSAAALGYASDLELVFPTGTGVFKAGGDLAFHHGGASLQELVIPVVTVRLPVASASEEPRVAVEVSGLPAAITNRMVTLSAVSLFGGVFVPALVCKGKRVGGIFGAVGSVEVDRDKGTIRLEPGVAVTMALLLGDDTAPSAQVIFLDPATDAEAYRSNEIPVRLGV